MASDDDESDVYSGLYDSASSDDEHADSVSTNPFMNFMPTALSQASTAGYTRQQRPLPNEPKKEKDVDRLLLMLKYPHAKEEEIQDALRRKEIQQRAFHAAALKKGQIFREKKQLEDAELWKQQQKQDKELPKSQVLQQAETELKQLREEGRDNIKKFVLRNKKQQSEDHAEGSFGHAVSNRISPRRSLDESDDMEKGSDAVVWQAATENDDCVDYEPGTSEQKRGPKQSRRSIGIVEQTRKSIRSVFASRIFRNVNPLAEADGNALATSSSTSTGDVVSLNTIEGFDNRSVGNIIPTSEESVVTQKISNIRPPNKEPDNNSSDNNSTGNNIYLRSTFNSSEEEEESDKKSQFVDKKRIKTLIIIFFLVIGIAGIIVLIATLNRRDKADPSEPSENQESNIPSPLPTISPVMDSPIMDNRPAVPMVEVTEAPASFPTESPTEQPFPDWEWFKEDEGGTLLQGIPEVDEHLGQSIALSDDGNILVIGVPDALGKSGIVRIYEQKDDSWVESGFLTGRFAGDRFGSAVALSSDGRVLAISEPSFNNKAGNVRTYLYSPSGYVSLQDLEGDASDKFGTAISLSSDGRRLAVGVPHHNNNSVDRERLLSGRAEVFELSAESDEWRSISDGSDGAFLIGTEDRDRFGLSIDLNDDGSLLCVGAPTNEEHGGYVQCFEESGTQWKQLGNTMRNKDGLVQSDDQFGSSMRISRDPSGSRHRVAIGAYGKDSENIFNAGHVVVYEFNPLTAERGWIRLGRKVITTASPGKDFGMGFSLDFYNDILSVGIPGANNRDGNVELFEFQKGAWEWIRHPTIFDGVASGSSSSYGSAISMTPRGDFAVGSPQSNENVGSVSVYRRIV